MIKALELEIKLLKAELKQKDEKLSELQNGLPIEKAKDGLVYAGWTRTALMLTKWDKEQRVWRGNYVLALPLNTLEVLPERVYPLPSTETQMEGE